MTEFFEDEHKSTIDWQKIKEYRTSGTESGLVLALVESHKLLIELLKRSGYRLGDEPRDSVLLARDRLTDLEGLLVALGVWEKVVYHREPLNKLDIGQAISSYQKAIYDLSTLTDYQRPGLWARLKAWLEINLIHNRAKRTKWFLYLISFILLIFLLDNYHYGQRFTSWLAELIGQAGFWILAVIIGIILIGFTVINLVDFLEERTK